MKICHITETYIPVGGIEQYILATIKLLEEYGHQNLVIYRNNHPDSIRNGRCPSHLVSYSRSDKGRGEILGLIDRESADVVLLHAIHDPMLIQEVAKAAPIVSYIHNFYPVCPGLIKYFRRGDQLCRRPFGMGCMPMIYLRRCSEARHLVTVINLMIKTWEFQKIHQNLNKIIVGSQYMFSLLEQNGFNTERINILPPHYDTPKEYVPPQDDPPIILFVGRLEIEKGVNYLLKAMVQIKQPCRLLIVGDGTLRSEYEGQTKCLNLGEFVEFLGWQDQVSIGNLYRKSTLVVMPSIWPEPFGKVGVEALSYGRPVVAFRVGGIPDWLEDGSNGYLVPSGNIGQLSERISELLSDRPKSELWGRNGQSMVMQRFKADQHASRLISILENARMKL